MSDVFHERLTLLQYTTKVLRQNPQSRKMFFGYTVDTIFNMMKWYLYGQIGKSKIYSTQARYYILFWILVSIIDSQIWYNLTNPIINKVINTSSRISIHDFYKKYSLYSQKDKNNCNAQKFKTHLDDACESVFVVIDWGLPQFLQLTNSFISCIIISISGGYIILPIFLFFVNIISYFCKIKKVQKEYSKKRKKRQKERTAIRTKHILRLPMFQYDEIPLSSVTDLNNDLLKIRFKNMMEWININWILNSINDSSLVIILIIPFFNTEIEIIDIIMIISIINLFNSSFKSFTYFVNRYDKCYTTFENFMVFSLFVSKSRTL